MIKIRNKWLRITGIILSMIGLALFVRPFICAVLGEKLVFSFFGLFSGYMAMIISAVFLVIGLLIISVTEPLDEEK